MQCVFVGPSFFQIMHMTRTGQRASVGTQGVAFGSTKYDLVDIFLLYDAAYMLGSSTALRVALGLSVERQASCFGVSMRIVGLVSGSDLFLKACVVLSEQRLAHFFCVSAYVGGCTFGFQR